MQGGHRQTLDIVTGAGEVLTRRGDTGVEEYARSKSKLFGLRMGGDGSANTN